MQLVCVHLRACKQACCSWWPYVPRNHCTVCFQADLLQLMVVRPMFQETTALGAALAAGLGADVWTRELVFASASYNNIDFKPTITDTEADKRCVE